MQHESFSEEQGEAEELLDDMALWVLQSPVSDAAQLKRAVWLNSLGLGLGGHDAEVERVERDALAVFEKRPGA